MTSVLVGKEIRRKEDHKHITGRAQFVDDLVFPNTVYVSFLRSPYAHANILKVDGSKAEASPHVLYVLTGDEAAKLAKPLPVYVYRPAREVRAPEYRALAYNKVRYYGEPVAAIVTTDRYDTEEMTDLVQVEYQELPVILDPEKAMQKGAPLVDDKIDDNIGIYMKRETDNVEKLFSEAHKVYKQRFSMHRHTGSPIEPRGILADFNKGTGILTIYSSTQIPHILKTHLAEILDFPENNIHVIAPDVGGGFGNKLHISPEEICTCILTIKLGRPMKWIESRTESLLSFVHAREQIHYVEYAVTREGIISAIKDKQILNAGGYLDSRVSGPALGASLWVPGPYRVQGFKADIYIVLTNKCPYAAYRGFGSQMGAMISERMIEMIAQDMKIDAIELRMRNMIRPEELPYTTASGLQYDSGDYPEALRRAIESIDYNNLRKKQAEMRKSGRYLGIGFSIAVEGAGWNTYTAAMASSQAVFTNDFATATLRMDVSGKVTVHLGTSQVGTGHATTAAQIIAEELGLSIDDVDVFEGDTAASPYDSGTRAARFTGVFIPALRNASVKLHDKVTKLAAHLLEARPEDIQLADATASVKGSPNRFITIRRLAQIAYSETNILPEDMPPGLEETGYFKSKGKNLCVTWPYSVHAAVVEVDPEDGKVRFQKYKIIHDCGPEINPMIVDGQMHGGTAQGIGGSILEELVYDENGHLMTSTFMDYLLPTAMDIPDMEIVHMSTPSPNVPGGAKGMSEGGVVYSYPAVVNAIADALQPFGVEIVSTPLSPDRILELIDGKIPRI